MVWALFHFLCLKLEPEADIGNTMWYDKVRLTFISKRMGQLAHINIPKKYLHITVFGIAAFLVCSLFMTASFFSQKVARLELESLRAESAELKERYQKLQTRLAEVEGNFNDLMEKEIAIRAVFGLPEVDLGQRQLGVGGPVSNIPPDWSENRQLALLAGQKIEHLARVSQFELQKLSEVEQAVLAKKQQLDHTPSICPTTGYMSRGFGMKIDPFTGKYQMHNGMDIANRVGTQIVASANGIVSSAGIDGGHGQYVTIDHGYGLETHYFHLSKIKVKRGDRISRGDVIGLMGSTGYSTGPHLHYEVVKNGKPINPTQFILN